MPNIRIFLVEDSPVIRNNLAATLEELAPVSVVGSAEDEAGALAWLIDPENKCELAIIDIFLKKGTGLVVLPTARATDPTRKVVVLSNYATPDMRRTCLRLGVDCVFDKSHDIDELIQYCQHLAEGSPS